MSEKRPIIWIEKIDDRARSSTTSSEKLITAGPDRFEWLGAALADSLDRFWAGLRSTDRPPAEVELELNIGVDARGDWLILSGKAHASATVKVIWRR